MHLNCARHWSVSCASTIFYCYVDWILSYKGFFIFFFYWNWTKIDKRCITIELLEMVNFVRILLHIPFDILFSFFDWNGLMDVPTQTRMFAMHHRHLMLKPEYNVWTVWKHHFDNAIGCRSVHVYIHPLANWLDKVLSI